MPLLYLIRHPRTQPDPSLRASQWELSEQGRTQVRALAALPLWAAVGAVITSAQRKAAAVGEAVRAAHGVPWHVVEALDEARRDSWLDPEQFSRAQRAFFAHPEMPPVPGWETARAAGARFAAAMDGGLAQYPGQSLAVVAHATVLTLYAARLRGAAPRYDDWRAIGFAAIMAVDRASLRPLTPFLGAPWAGLPSPATP
ncbi:MAG: histidine phosphatase family protein [Chloroflexota bacterium]